MMYRHFFQDLCKYYARSGGEPLRLKRLDLGLGVLLLRDNKLDQSRTVEQKEKESTVQYTASYLSLLTNLSSLEEVHIENRNHYGPSGKDCAGVYGEDMEVFSDFAWWTFTPDRTPNLRRLTAYEYMSEVHAFLWELSPEYTEQLAIAFSILHGPRTLYCDAGNERDELQDLLQPDPKYPNLPLRFRMMDMSLTDTPYNGPGGVPYVPWSQALSSLSGLYMPLEVNKLEDVQPSRMFQNLVHTVRSLPNLTQLEVEIRSWSPPSWSYDDLETRQMVIRIAIVLVDNGESLRHIKVGHISCRVYRDGDKITIVPLAEYEEEEVELFQKPYPMWPTFDMAPRHSYGWSQPAAS
ncbi:hypothetical protein GE09DRAFT_411904 [Coniochaeta sp. 2T2.1]|nr:hypothetical protein GE09DRAFT_411904 [Coniochaeta sp. 2T2.1]